MGMLQNWHDLTVLSFITLRLVPTSTLFPYTTLFRSYVWNPDGKLGAGAYVEDRLAAHAWVYLVATFDDPGKPNARVQLYKDRKSTRLNSSHPSISYAVFCLKKKNQLRLSRRPSRPQP